MSPAPGPRGHTGRCWGLRSSPRCPYGTQWCLGGVWGAQFGLYIAKDAHCVQWGSSDHGMDPGPWSFRLESGVVAGGRGHLLSASVREYMSHCAISPPSRLMGVVNKRAWPAQARRIISNFVTLAQTLTNDGNRGDSSSPPDIWRGCHHPFITLNKEHRQPKQAAAIPIAILSHNIDACKESARIIGSSRREVKPLLTDKPFNITPHNKPSTTQSFANDSDERYPSPPAFGRGHYAPSHHAQPKKL